MHQKGFPIRYMSLNLSKYYIYLIGLLYFFINKNEKKNIIRVIYHVLWNNIK
jgi:hypothetical protein